MQLHDRSERLLSQRLIGVVAPVLAVVVALAACSDGPRETGQEAGAVAADGRAVIVVPPQAQQMVRAEMRKMLSALNGVLTAAATSDSAAVVEAARSGGMAVAVDTDPAIADRLPDEFKRLGVDTHRAFDGVAEAAETGASIDTIAARLGRLTANCVACHESYRLEISDSGD